MASATGTYRHSMDAKGRLFIPAQLRKVLGESLHLSAGTDKFIMIYAQETWENITARFRTLSIGSTENARRFFGNTFECEADSQGRIVIPQALRSYAELQKEAVIVGVENRVEIWSAERWDKENEAEITPEEMRSLIASLGI